MEYKICVVTFSNLLSEAFTFYKEFSEILSQMYRCLRVKYPSFMLDFNYHEFLERFFFNAQISYGFKIRPVGASCYIQTDGRIGT